MIAQAVEQIRNTVSLSVLDESATKQGVVLRLLSLAGWDTFDVSQVVPEYTVGNRRVDYALRPGSPNAVFIEVKRPGENLERHQQQLLEYCFQEGVKLAVLTNGRTWWLYLPLQAGSWQQRRFLTIDLEVQEPSVVDAGSWSTFLRNGWAAARRLAMPKTWSNRSSGPRLSAKPSPQPGPRSSELPMNSWLT